MNFAVSLIADFAIDPGEMRDGIASFECLVQSLDVISTNRPEFSAVKRSDAVVAVIDAARYKNWIVAFARQLASQVTSDKTRSAGDCYFHKRPSQLGKF